MIKFSFKWMITQAILNLRSISFYLLTIILSFGFILTDSVIKEYNEDTQVLVYSEDSSLGKYVCEYLGATSIDGFDFREATDIEDIKLKVATGDVACGVVFLDSVDDFRHNTNSVVIYQSSGTVEGYVIQELIYPILNRGSARDELVEYLSKLKWNDTKESSIEYIAGQYDIYLDSMDINIYNVSSLSGSDTDSAEMITSKRDNIQANRTRSYIYVVLICLITAICVYEISLSDKGFYKAFVAWKRRLLYIEKTIVTVVMITAGSFILFLIYGIWV